ncbi:MAG: COX15/CtaA family protein [Elusimicrobia bacterium]|nr:COX15/CtaA family protein [Elusimicrobiota bacterium]
MPAAGRTPGVLHRLSRVTACAAFVLIVAGASVTSTGSGLAVPDWPLSYGQWLPPMEGGVFFEHGHRMIASGVGLLVWLLAFVAWRQPAARWVRNLALVAAAAVLFQGLLGGVTVLYGLAKPVSVAHACLGQALFALLVFLATATGPSWPDSSSLSVDERRAASRVLRLAFAASAAVFLQLLLGASYRHGLAGIAPHLLGAVLAAGLSFAAAFRALAELPAKAGLAPVAGSLAAAVAAQLLLGLGALARSPAVSTLHVAVGALILALCVVVSARLHRLAGPEAAPAWLEH